MKTGRTRNLLSYNIQLVKEFKANLCDNYIKRYCAVATPELNNNSAITNRALVENAYYCPISSENR